MSFHYLSDLDQFVLSVREKESGRLIAEAIVAYHGGALRAAIMSTWISVAYDIIAKARELASQGERAPQKFIRELDEAIAKKDRKKMQLIENSLLTTAKDGFQFFAPHECDDLERLKHDRDLCAHPAFVSESELFHPTPELVRTHIVHAIQHLLCQAPLQGKSVIQRFDTDILSASFPRVPAEIETVLRQRYLGRAKESLVIGLIKGLISCPLGHEHAKYAGHERQIAQSLAAIGRIRPDVFDGEARHFIRKKAQEASDERILAFIRMAAADPRIWDWINESDKIRIRRMLEQATSEQVRDFDLSDSLDIPNLKNDFLLKFESMEQEVRQAIIAEQPRAEFSDCAIELYSRSHSFRNAEILGESIILPLARYFTSSQLEKILSAVEENSQIHLAAGSPHILEKLYGMTIGLLPQTAGFWEKFILSVERGRDPSDQYAYPNIRSKLSSDGYMSQ